ncbi:MAG: glutamate synthase subunit beta [Deltaproteobacteria bacterium]|nr:glutamate synthase subunit beta [Deltaproteobacteria bacterium]
MGKPTGFLELARELPVRRPVAERLQDSLEIDGKLDEPALRNQASRCMDCAVPFCHSAAGCPLGNLIPEWNDLVYRGRFSEALDRLHATNNFPEFTGRVCPAPCEGACVLNAPTVASEAVTIKQIEKQIIDRGFRDGLIVAKPAAQRSAKRVAIVGSGPAGLACAQQLARAGHAVTVFERAPRIGGLLRYGIPDFKLEKHTIDRRLQQLEAEGVAFRTGVDVGKDLTLAELEAGYDAIVLAVGATAARDLQIPGRDLGGIHLAMPYLCEENERVAGDRSTLTVDARGKDVVILGGGDTGSDCLGTALRQGAKSVTQLELMARPPEHRAATNPWPAWPLVFRTSSSQEEGGRREFALLTKRFIGTGRVEAIETVRIEWSKDASAPFVEVPGSEQRFAADLVLLALGFTGPEAPFFERARALPKVYVCGDAQRGASLVVWAIWEGRQCAHAIDAAFAGRSRLPLMPLTPP